MAYLRILLTAIILEVLGIAILALLVAATGPREPRAVEAYAEHLGRWVGPISGFVLCLGAGWRLASRQPVNRKILTGLLLGLTAAAVDLSILALMAVAFQPLFAISNAGRICAGTLGGWLASRRS